MITGIDHVQLAIPADGVERARHFFGVLLGMPEVTVPEGLTASCWFESGSAAIHIGIDEPFTPAGRAHPALLTTDLDALQARLEDAGHACVRADDIPGVVRFHTHDPFGNRIEFRQA
ncbi:VOC family protein [Demequina sp. NBRC 110056]|uniref:VOC family protein n=1 Tax=Demequina sp. NBRC 110056 TaxID=1570345 RepID=UPI000A05E8BB|nr:VOC family protein [Demequina sp. NBRC 110056]